MENILRLLREVNDTIMRVIASNGLCEEAMRARMLMVYAVDAALDKRFDVAETLLRDALRLLKARLGTS